MSNWQTLGLEPTYDKKIIKRAYAALLKVTRPDETPEAFKQLYAAYQQALHFAQTEINAIQSEATGAVAEQQALDEAGNNTSHADELSRAPTQAEVVSPVQLEGERLVKRVRELLENNSEVHELEAWSFLTESNYILDDSFNWQLGMIVLQLVYEYNQKNKDYPMRVLGKKILTRLDLIFSWTSNRRVIFHYLDPQAYAPLLDLIDEYRFSQSESAAIEALRGAQKVAKKPKVYYQHSVKTLAVLKDRLYALFIDGLVLTVLMVVINYLIDNYGVNLPDASGLLWIVFIFCYFLFFDMSPLQATPGKLAMGLKVTTKEFERASWRAILLRTFLFGLTFIGNLPVLMINLYLVDRFLHDRITKTSLIDTDK